jgi:hypothetical protein
MPDIISRLRAIISGCLLLISRQRGILSAIAAGPLLTDSYSTGPATKRSSLMLCHPSIDG